MLTDPSEIDEMSDLVDGGECPVRLGNLDQNGDRTTIQIRDKLAPTDAIVTRAPRECGKANGNRRQRAVTVDSVDGRDCYPEIIVCDAG
ncbi:MAG TPA: hypothetical protein VKB09_10790 [Thermomicrobiales bacterium]|nr:hypothetical protein [Thermomicrobiales bacterium]